MVRLVLIVLWCAANWGWLLVVGALRDLVDRVRGRGSDRTARWRTRRFGRWTDGLGRILGMRCEIEGAPPAPPFFLVTNHLGYMDVVLLGRSLDCVFVAKAEVADWPLIGAMCRTVDTIFIDRTRKRDIPRVMEQIERVLASGRGIVVFPEGTSTSGERVERFRPSLLDAAARAARPVSWAGVEYRAPEGYPPARDSICWWGDRSFFRHFYDLLRLPGFTARIRFGTQPIVATDRKVLAGRLQDAVASALCSAV